MDAADIKLPEEAARRRQSPGRTAHTGIAKEPTRTEQGNSCDQCFEKCYHCCIKDQLDLTCWGCCIGILYGMCFECSSCCRAKK